MPVSQILFFIFMAFAGYFIGRLGHIFGGHLKTPHHWIYGFLLMVPISFFSGSLLWLLVFSFGAGLFLSDLKDFLKLKFMEPDEKGEKKFWGVD